MYGSINILHRLFHAWFHVGSAGAIPIQNCLHLDPWIYSKWYHGGAKRLQLTRNRNTRSGFPLVLEESCLIQDSLKKIDSRIPCLTSPKLCASFFIFRGCTEPNRKKRKVLDFLLLVWCIHLSIYQVFVSIQFHFNNLLMYRCYTNQTRAKGEKDIKIFFI